MSILYITQLNQAIIPIILRSVKERERDGGGTVGDGRNDHSHHINMKQSYRKIAVAHNRIINHNKNISTGNKNVLSLHLQSQNSSKNLVEQDISD